MTSAAAPARVLLPPASPYKGLAPFEDSEVDELLFFGRERDRAVIVANLLASRLTVLYGATGVGKSSVLRAGVARDLRVLPEQPLVVVHDAWADDPVGSLIASIAAAAGIEPSSLPDTVELAAALHGDVYVLLDQLEEYFVYLGADPLLADGLAELVARPELPVHILLAIRDDALARLDTFKVQLPSLLSNRLRLDHLTRAAGRRAIVGPIESFGALVSEEEGLAVEPELVEAVLDGVRAGAVVQAERGRGMSKAAAPQGRIETPYLQLVMQRLWEVERAEGSRVLRLRTLERLGGPSPIVEAHLARALAGLTAAQLTLAAGTFDHLVTPSGMKIAHETSDLADWAGTTAEEIQPVLTALSRERILRPVGGESGEAYEIFHDVLADAVLVWRARFLAEQALERERAAAKRKHRRLLGGALLCLAAVAAMAAIAFYAVEQRNDAQASAAQAQQQQLIAEARAKQARAATKQAQAATATAQQQEQEANDQRKRAVVAEADAKTQADAADQAADDANQQKVVAQAAQDDAEQQAIAARNATGDAETQRRAATDALALAQKAETQARRQAERAERLQREAVASKNKAVSEAAAARKAEHEAKVAEAAALDAQRNEEEARADAEAALQTATEERAKAEEAATLAEAREYAYNAVSQLATDPEKSLELALQAVDRDPDLPLAEGTLRQALIATRALTQLDAGGAASDVALSPDGRFLATAGSSDARVFDLEGKSPARASRSVAAANESPVRRLPAGGAVLRVSFSSDGSTILTAGADGRAILWNAATGEVRFALAHGGRVETAAFSPDGRLVATAGGKGGAKLWDPATGALLYELAIPVEREGATPAQLVGAAFSPDSSRLVTFGNEDSARVFDTTNGQLMFSVEHGDWLKNAGFSPDGSVIATSGRDDDTRLWSAADGTRLYDLHTSNDVRAAIFSPDGQRVLTIGAEGTGRIWNVASGALEQVLAGHLSLVTSAAYSPDGRWIATAGSDRTARLWTAEGGSGRLAMLGHDDVVNRVIFTADGSKLITASNDGTVRIWDARVDPELNGVAKHAAAANAVAFSPDGKTLVSGGDDKELKLLRVHGHTAARSIPAGTRVRDVAFSRAGTMIAAAGADGTARVWRFPQAGTPQWLLRPQKAMNAVAFSPDGKLLATAGNDKNARLIPLAGGELVLLRHPVAVNDVAFSPDGKLVATAAADRVVRLWQVDTGELVGTLNGHTAAVTSVAFSPDGKLLVTASRDHDARIWDVDSRERKHVLHGHVSVVNDAAFSADGRWVVTAGPGKAGIWPVEAEGPESDRLMFVGGLAGPINSAAFAPSGFFLATAGSDGGIRTFTCRLCVGVEGLEALATEQLAALGVR